MWSSLIHTFKASEVWHLDKCFGRCLLVHMLQAINHMMMWIASCNPFQKQFWTWQSITRLLVTERVQPLLQEHKLSSVGSLSQNKRQIPPEFIKSRGVNISVSWFCFQKDITLVSHITKKIDLLMSSLSNGETIDSSTDNKKKMEINTQCDQKRDKCNWRTMRYI